MTKTSQPSANACPPEPWSVTIFAKNEAATIIPCLRAVTEALGERRALVTVIVNGSTDTTADRVREFMRATPRATAAFEIGWADKSNAWNQFLYRLRPPASVYFFVDGYAIVERDGLEQLARALAATNANAAAALPSCGRGAAAFRRQLRREGGLHGSFHALSGPFVERICARNIRLPVGLYWGDGLIGSMAMHDLRPLEQAWQRSLIAVAEEASWYARPLSPIRWSDLKRQWNRMIQQQRGRLQSEALKETIHRGGYEAMPEAIDPMVLAWIAEAPAERMPSWRDNPLGWLAVRRLRRLRAPALHDREAKPLLPSPPVPSQSKVLAPVD